MKTFEEINFFEASVIKLAGAFSMEGGLLYPVSEAFLQGGVCGEIMRWTGRLSVTTAMMKLALLISNILEEARNRGYSK